MLLMLATAASTSADDLSLDLLGGGAGLVDVHRHHRNWMGGFSVTGSRMNATVPANSSTANSTIGNTGCRMAQAEMFFMTAVLPSR